MCFVIGLDFIQKCIVIYNGSLTLQSNWWIDLSWQAKSFLDTTIGVFFQCPVCSATLLRVQPQLPDAPVTLGYCHSFTADAVCHLPFQLSKTLKYNHFAYSLAFKYCWFFSNIVDKFQVSKHMLFHFSKPSLVIIYDLETNHDCLCLGYFRVDLFNRICHFTSVSLARISPLSALLDQNVRGCAAPQSSQACAHIHLCIAYTHGFMSWGKCTCPSALGHMFSDWFAHREAAGALNDKCMRRALWPRSLRN